MVVRPPDSNAELAAGRRLHSLDERTDEERVGDLNDGAHPRPGPARGRQHAAHQTLETIRYDLGGRFVP